MRVLLSIFFLAAAATAAPASVPVCPGLSPILQSNLYKEPKALTPGSKVTVRIKVKNRGLMAASGVAVRLTSSMLAGFVPKGGAPTSRRVEGGSVYWIDQGLAPGKRRVFTVLARVCAAPAPSGSPRVIAEAAVYRLNATGGVRCLSRTAPMTVGRMTGLGIKEKLYVDPARTFSPTSASS